MKNDRYAQRQAKGISISRGAKPPVWVSVFRDVVRTGSRALRGNYERIDPSSYVFPELKRVDVNDVTLSYLHWAGKGPTLLLIHGLNCNAWIWARAANLLREGRNVIAVNLRGHGSSTAPPGGYDHETTTRDLLQFLDRVAPGPVDVAGHSWGGMVSFHLVAADPGRFRSLILADPVLPRGLNFLYRKLDVVIDAIFAVERGPFKNREDLERGRRNLLYLHWCDEIDRRFWASNFHKEADGSYHHVLPDSAYDEIFYRTLMTDISEVVPRINCPTLLMLPTSPINFLPGEYRKLRRSMFMLEKRIRGDHAFFHSNAVAAAREMETFLKRISN